MNVAELRNVTALRGYSDADLEALLGVAPVRAFKQGEFLCNEGTVGRSCFIVVRGEVEVVQADVGAAGGQRVLAVLPAGSLVGQMALVDHEPRSASIRARTAVVALEIEREVFERLITAASPLGLRFQDQIAVTSIRQLRRATERLLKLAAQPVEKPAARPAVKARTQARVKVRVASAAPPAVASAPTGAPAPRGSKAASQTWSEGLAVLKAATREWAIPLEEIDAVEVVRPGGIASPAEAKARNRDGRQ